MTAPHRPRKATGMSNARIIDNTAVPAPRPASRTLSALLSLGRPLVMGILNVTPNSFSDGGRFLDPTKAIAHGNEMAKLGADIIDIGAESTRPYGGAVPISADDEKSRLAPVLPALTMLGVPISIDTIKASIAAWALDQGASIVNDVWGLQRDPAMAPLVAQRSVPVIIMHNRDAAEEHIDIIADVMTFFARSLEIAARAGIPRDNIVLDPGIGFGKTAEQSIIVYSASSLNSDVSVYRFSSALRGSVLSVRLYHQPPMIASAARSPPIYWRSKKGRPSSAHMMSPRRFRLCG